jgi:hypothetical protein
MNRRDEWRRTVRTITDVLRRDCGFGLDVPKGDGWLRMPCPFCGRSGGTANQGAQRAPAAVNHRVGWFTCHACGVRRSATYDSSVASRFTAVLRQAAYAAWRQFPGVLTLDEARSHANERLAVYAGPDDGSCAEAGALERWEKKTEGNESQLDRYVLHALNCDLLDYGRKLIRRAEREKPAGDGSACAYDEHDGSPGAAPRPGADGKARVWRGDFFLTRLLDTKSWEDWEYMRDSGQFEQSRYPLLYATKIDGLTRDEVADVTGWSLSTVKARIADEKRRLAAEYYGT